jgi:DNA (cytosine-5)-methyltransferase 1
MADGQRGKIGGVYASLITKLEALGYRPKMRVIKAAEYGVAQMRQRVFIVSTSEEFRFEFPDPTHADPKHHSHSLSPMSPYVSCKDALRGLGKPLPHGSEQPDNGHLDITPAGDRRRIHAVSEGSHLAREIHLPADQSCNLSKKDTTKFRRLS